MDINSILLLLMFVVFVGLLLMGFHVAFTLFGVAVLFTGLGQLSDIYLGTTTGLDFNFFGIIVERLFSLMENWILIAGPMFIFMGLVLERSEIAERLLQSTQELFGNVRGGLAVTVAAIGILLAASTGIIGASVVLLGVLSLPTMIKQGYSKRLAVGTVAASGCLGIIIPPSIMLVFMADQIGLPVGDLFMGAVFPGVILGLLYIVYIIGYGFINPKSAPLPVERRKIGLNTIYAVLRDTIPVAILIFLVLGSIIAGIATVTEASGVGALGAVVLAYFYKKLSLKMIKESLYGTFNTIGYIFCIIVGASCFAFVMRGIGGDEIIERILTGLPFGPVGVILFIVACVFLLGFFLDWIEITFIILPLIVPAVGNLGITIEGYGVIDNPALVWFTVLIALTLQTSYLTPPVGYALFYIKGVCPPEIEMTHIYKGIIPFVILQILAMMITIIWPKIVTWLPAVVYG